MVFKKEYPPSEDELAVLRNGEEWTKEKEQEIALRVSILDNLFHFMIFIVQDWL